jgi:hypothetical protein
MNSGNNDIINDIQDGQFLGKLSLCGDIIEARRTHEALNPVSAL